MSRSAYRAWPQHTSGLDRGQTAQRGPGELWSDGASSRASGFTLIEVVVALAILSMVVLGFLGTRTEALIDASEGRNWRLAREFAEELLSELQAGARQAPPRPGRVKIEKYEDFEYQILVGESVIAEHEANEASSLGGSADESRGDRIAWQRERDDLRLAQQKGLGLQDYRDQQFQEDNSLERENAVPSEDDLEEVLVAVYFPDVRPKESGETGESSFKLRAKVSTLAIEGLTPEEADSLAAATGKAPASDPGSGAAGGDGGGGN